MADADAAVTMNVELTPDSHEFARHMDDLRQLLNRKWEPHILAALSRKPMRYSELRVTLRRLPASDGWQARPGRHITDKVLGETLEAMQDDGFVTRQLDESETPPVPIYALTLTAVELMYALRPTLRWVAGHPEVVERAKQGRRVKDRRVIEEGP